MAAEDQTTQSNNIPEVLTASDGARLRRDLDKALESGIGPKIARFALAALGGIPFAGGAISGAGSAWSEHDQEKINHILASWLKLQEDEIKEIGLTMMEVMSRLNLQDEEIEKRIESPEYLKLVKKAFRDWSAAESEEKRVLIRNLLSNAAASKITTDDVVALFIQWIADYSEAHFKVVRDIYTNPGATRSEIWSRINGAVVREDSAEADLFKLIIYDLSTGHVIRQHREKDYYGNFVKTPNRTPSSQSNRMTSAFDDGKQYELTELGKQFVHYTMNEIVPRIAAANQQ